MNERFALTSRKEENEALESVEELIEITTYIRQLPATKR
jgi:hypothetical protein